jgi:hypothetical protein
VILLVLAQCFLVPRVYIDVKSNLFVVEVKLQVGQLTLLRLSLVRLVIHIRQRSNIFLRTRHIVTC